MRPVDSTALAAPVAFNIALTLATPRVYRGTMVVPAGVLAGNRARRIQVVWVDEPFLPEDCSVVVQPPSKKKEDAWERQPGLPRSGDRQPEYGVHQWTIGCADGDPRPSVPLVGLTNGRDGGTLPQPNGLHHRRPVGLKAGHEGHAFVQHADRLDGVPVVFPFLPRLPGIQCLCHA